MTSRTLRWVAPDEPLPPAAHALTEPSGLLAATLDLSAERLLQAYRGGIFPWYSEGQPVLWWSPDPRMVLALDRFKVSRSLVKTVRQLHRKPSWCITLNRQFEGVMRACAAPRPGHPGTWISEDIIAAYVDLHRRGYAHSVEVWTDARCDTLAGGLYGVSIGRMFYGESMFARATDASKVALFSLVTLLKQLGFRVIDCQQNTRHLSSLGAAEVSRVSFLSEVIDLTQQASPNWRSVRITFPQV